MKLLDVQKNKVVISPEALTIKEFKAIWDNDTSKDKQTATEELSYVGFISDRKSPYITYSVEIRGEKIVKDIITTKNWKPSKLVNEAIDKYKDLNKTFSSGLLEDAEYGLYKLRSYLRNIADKFEDDDDNGKSAEKYITNLEKLDKILKSYDSLKERVDKEESDGTKIWGGGKLGNREMPKRQ